MQSFLQYRRFELSVKRKLEQDLEIANPDVVQTSDVRSPQAAHHLDSTASTISCATGDWKVSEPSLETQAGQQAQVLSTRLHQSLDDHSKDADEHQEDTILVSWEGDDDPLNPRNWSVGYRVWCTFILAGIGFAPSIAASADVAVNPQAAAYFGVSDVVETMAIGLFFIGYGTSALFVGPFSEIFGRNAVYIVTLSIFMLFIMAAGLSQNIGEQLTFRFLAGAFGATPLTTAGGSISDMWPSLEKTWAFPIFAILGFGGPLLGPVFASHVIELGSWRWAEWIVLIATGFVLIIIILFQPETYAPLLLSWKARHLRRLTGNDKYKSELEVQDVGLLQRLKVALIRPFKLAFEPIVLCMSLYLTILYVVVFTFFDGYPYIFEKTYGVSQEMSNVIFGGIFAGVLVGSFSVPLVYKITKRSFGQNKFVPEVRLWYAMLGSPAIPIAMFWMAWTDYASITIWSPILASGLLGYGFGLVFLTAYLYIIDSYEAYSASALTFVTVTRYVTAGGMTIAGVPFYKNVGPHWTITILGIVVLIMTPIPYAFYRYGHLVRKRSKMAVKYD